MLPPDGSFAILQQRLDKKEILVIFVLMLAQYIDHEQIERFDIFYNFFSSFSRNDKYICIV